MHVAKNSRAADIKAIEALDAEWGAAGSRHDVDAVVALYAKDGVLVWPDAKAVHGTAAIKRAWKKFIDETPGLGIAFVAEKITISDSGDIAVDFGKVILTMTGENGKKMKMVAKYLVTWIKVRGKWKVQYDSWNSNSKA
jgi:uncharacterized protein (TIGR02246 family)